MQYKDLPRIELLQKLMATSFATPSQNREVFEWCNKISKELNFLENERRKLIEKYGEKKDGSVSVKDSELENFMKEFKIVLDMEVKDIPQLPLTEASFEDDVCCYPKEKEMWINAQEILKIVDINKKQGD